MEAGIPERVPAYMGKYTKVARISATFVGLGVTEREQRRMVAEGYLAQEDVDEDLLVGVYDVWKVLTGFRS